MFGFEVRNPRLDTLQFLLRLWEPVLLMLCAIATYYLREGFSLSVPPGPMALTALGVFLFGFIAGTLGLYETNSLRSLVVSIPRLLVALLMTFSILLLLLFMFKISAVFSRIWLGTWMASSGLLLLGVRWWLRESIARKFRRGFWRKKIVILGTNAKAVALVKLLETSYQSEFKIMGVYGLDGTAPSKEGGLGKYYSGDLAKLLQHSCRDNLDDVIITEDLEDLEYTGTVMRKLHQMTVNVLYCLPVSLSGRMGPGGLPLVMLFKKPLEGHSIWLKRMLDVAASGGILLLISPILLGVALVIKMTSPGPVFFRQKRGGFHGNEFEMLKFRSMKVGAEAMRDENGKELQAQKQDPRITPIGRLLRKTSVDELPQLINVLRGDMSLVGPRPHVPSHNSYYEDLIDSYASRHKMKPGLTGWAQLNGWRGETETLDKMVKRVEFDIWYTENWSLWLDIKIIFLTPFVTVFQRGAY